MQEIHASCKILQRINFRPIAGCNFGAENAQKYRKKISLILTLYIDTINEWVIDRREGYVQVQLSRVE